MTITKKYVIAITIAMIVVSITTAVFISFNIAQSQQDYAEKRSKDYALQVQRLLVTSDSLVMEKIAVAMNLMKTNIDWLGSVSVTGQKTLNSSLVPDIQANGMSLVGAYDFIDDIAAKIGGTATIFVRDGNQFTRVATNIVRDGKRAVGTTLNKQGQAYQNVVNGSAFYGKVSILGVPYLTGYEPIIDSAGQIIGVLYVGFKADLSEVEQALENITILDSGFVALLDSNNNVMAKSKHVNNDIVSKAITNTGQNKWQSRITAFEPWGFNIVTAYSEEDISDRTVSGVVDALFIIVIAAIVIVILVLTLTRSLVIKDLFYMIEKFDLISDGDLTVRLDEKRTDEIGDIAKSFNKVLNRLQSVISEIAAASEQLSTASEQLANTSSDTNARIKSQTMETEQVATAIEEMSVTVKEVSISTEQAAQAAEEAEQQSELGAQVVKETINNIEQLSSQIQETSVAVNQLSESSNSITSVLEVIQSIAEQINLLALNAAIEAARAGQHGRGFAVVADEVRSLAARTQSSTQEIQIIVDKIREGASVSVEMMKNSVKNSQDTAKTALGSNDALDEILNSVKNITNLNTSVATASEEQNVVADEIARSVVNIKNAALENSANAEQTLQASQELSELAKTLLKRIRFFR